MHGNSLTIRPLDAPDAAAFRQLRMRAIEDAPTAVWPTLEEEAARSDAEICARIAPGPAQVVFGAFDGAGLVAIAGLRGETLQQVRHKGSVWGVFVDPAYRKRGIAGDLFARLRDHAHAHGLLQLSLYVNAENAPAKALYASLGFVTCGIDPRAMQVAGRFYDEAYMVLGLDTGTS